MDFSDALRRIKGGEKATRTGWNGPRQYVYYMPGYPDGIPMTAGMAQALGVPEGTVCEVEPYLMMRTARGSHAKWHASNSDLLTDDWKIFDPKGD